MPEFSHLNTESDFPHIESVNVYQYQNDLDYGRFDIEQMSLQLCDVPWDVGEAHVGQRTISGIGNVVYFETPERRDAWFDAIPEAKPGEDPSGKCFRWQTKFKELHRDQIIDIPVPYNVAALFNYLVVTYVPFASKGDFLDYETGLGKLKWFWFVREVEFVAPNTTRLHLLDDAFQTWIYDVNVSGMVLERGHAPMFATRASAYLQNPLANNKGLLTEDVNYGSANIVSHIDALALNSGDMWACIATSALPTGVWGSKADGDWKVPTSTSYTQGGVPSCYVFAIEPAHLSTFLSTISQSFPQFAQTVQAVFFAPKNLVSVSNTFEFANVTCSRLTASRQTLNLSQLTKSDFAYPSQYAEIAKLYTSPYAHIEIVDENGNVDMIKVEDTTGKLDVSAALSLSYPFITINAHLLGAGGTPSATVTFRNISSQTFKIQGTWYETLREWQVPTFAIFQNAAKTYDYRTYFDREQAKLVYANEYDNATASATVAQTNSNASSLTAKENTATNAQAAYDNTAAGAQANKENVATSAQADKANADASADTQTSNAAIQVSANSSITARSNSAAASDTNLANLLSIASQAYEAGFTFATTNNEIDAKTASAAVGVGGGIAGSAVQGLMSGGPIGAVGGLISGAISGATSMIQTSIATNLSSAQASESVSLSENKTTSTNTNNTERTTNQNSANSDNTSTTNTAITGTAANLAATAKANATRSQTAANTAASNTYSTEIGNASRTQTAANTTAQNSYDTAVANAKRSYDTSLANAGRTRNTAINAISNKVSQAGLSTPEMFGVFSHGDSATTKPMALFANVVTQSKSAIAAAGDEFLRYGYMFGMQWNFAGNWNIGKYFTYWKLRDFWVSDLQVPDLYMDKLRFFLFGGVTIWRKPEYIGKVSIYDNFN